MKMPLKDRRRSNRVVWPADVAIHVLEPSGLAPIDHVNVSEGGLCLRLPAMLEVRSLIRFQLASGGVRTTNRLRPMECTGRVAWVTQRLDLRNMPPYLFDIGVEFVNPPRFLARLLSQKPQIGRENVKASSSAKHLSAVTIRGRRLVPRIMRDGEKPTPWHFIVSVDDSPCFSRRFSSESAAFAAWQQFQRKQARGRRNR